MNRYHEDELLMSDLINADDRLIKAVYDRMENDFLGFIIKYFNCEKSKAIEIYPETFTKFYFNIKDGKLKAPLKSSLKTYLFAIGKRVYLKNNHGSYNKKIQLDSDLPEVEAAGEILEHYEYEAQRILVTKLLNTIGDKCRDLLTMFYIEEIDSSQICERLGITSLGTLRKRKFDCMQKMRQLMSEFEITE